MRVSRAVSLVVVAGYLIAALVSTGWDPRIFILAVPILLFPLALIWFPDVFSSYLGPTNWGRRIDQESPPLLIAIAGWFFLVGLPLVVFLIARAKG